MSRSDRGVVVAKNVRRDAFGLSARAYGKGRELEKRYALDTDLDVIQRWQAKATSELLDRAADAASRQTVVRGTLTARVLAYLKRRTGRKGYKSDRSHLAAWTKAFGPRQWTRLTDADCENLIATWRSAGRSEKTIRHRVRVLKECWKAIDGARCPVASIKLPTPVRPNPTPVSQDIIRKVAASLRAGLTIRQRCGPTRKMSTVSRAVSAVGYARFLVRALTGQRADQIMRAIASDVDLEARIWWVRPAKGGHQVPYPLNDEQIVAWRIFIAADAWGEWDWRAFSKLLKRHGWPAHVPPKNLRHTFAIDHLLAGTDIGDLQGLLGHANIQTTRTFYAPVLLSRLKGAVARRSLNLVPGEAVPGKVGSVAQFTEQKRTAARVRSARRSGLKLAQKA